MATVADCYVDTASTTGGDGTTSATTGTNRAYHSLAAALSARAANLVTADQQLVIHCNASGGAADTTAPGSFAGWTTDATRFLTIQVDLANRHSGIYNTSKYRVEGSFFPVFNAPPQYTRFVGLQALCSGDDVGTSLWNMAAGTASQGCRVISCIGRWTDKNYAYGSLRWVQGGTDQAGVAVIVANCVFYGGVGTHGRGGSFAIGGINSNIVAYNNTLIGFGAAYDSTSTAFVDGYGRVKCVNNIVIGWSGFGAHASSSDYNATDLATASGGAHDRTSQTFTFVSGSYQPDSTDAGAKGYGTDLSADATYPFSDDVAGSTRSAPWDIGAFMAAGASGVTATGSAGEGEGVAGSATSSESATATAGEGEGATGTASVSEAVTGAAGQGEAVAGSATLRESATGTAGEGQAVSSSVTLSDAATGAGGEGQGVSGTVTESIAASGSAGEAEGAAGSTTASESATGTAGEGEGVSGAVGESAPITGSAGEGEGLSGTLTMPSPGTISSATAGEGEGVAGAATLSEAATGAAGEGQGVSGTATISESAAGTAAEGQAVAGSATEQLAASGAAGEAQSVTGTATVSVPGAPTPLKVTRVFAGPLVRVTRVYAGPLIRVTRVETFPS